MGSGTDADAQAAAFQAGMNTWRGTDAQAAAPEKGDLQRQFATALNVGWWEGLTSSPQEIIAARTPDQIIDAFAEVRPEWKSVMDRIKEDGPLSGSLKNALVKDPTMLDGFAELVDGGNGQTKPEDIAAALKDPKARKALGFVLDKVADEEYEFSDLKRFMEGTRQQQMAQLGDMGFNPMAAMDMQDILGMLKNFLRDPMGTMNQMADMFATGPEQREAMQPMIDAASTMFGVALGPIHGEDVGYGGHIANAIEWGESVHAGGRAKDYFDALSGNADAANRDLISQREQAGTGNTDIAANSFGNNVRMGENGRLGGTYDTAAAGATPPERAPAPDTRPIQEMVFQHG